MELVIRTAHGSADVDLVTYDDTSTIRDLLDAVTGLAAPNVVTVDGRPTRTDERIVDAIGPTGLKVGAVIDVASERAGRDRSDDDAGVPVVRLRQLTGRGTGVTVDLPVGRYRFGAGRRLVDGELGRAVVEEEAFTVSVGASTPIETTPHPSALADGADDVVTVRARPGANVAGEMGPFTPLLGRQLFDRELVWSDERLSVGGRVFDLVDPASSSGRPATIGAARLGEPDRDGIRTFDAAGTLAVFDDDRPAPELPVFGAAARVADATRTLWRRRPTDRHLDVPFGLSADHTATVSVDLERHTGVAIAGTTDFTSALARTLLVELVTSLGPADLDLVVVASAGRLGRWDWMKWLPHVRGGDPTAAPIFLSSDDEVEAWLATHGDDDGDTDDGDTDDDDTRDRGPSAAVATTASALPPPSGRPHPRPNADVARQQTLLLVDDAAHWVRRESPLRPFLVDPPRSTKILATVEHAADAPGACTAVIDEIRPESTFDADDAVDSGAATRLFGSLSRSVERLGGSPIETTDVRPSLTQTSTAADIARSLACLDDLRVRRDVDADAPAPRVDRPSIRDLLATVEGSDAPTADASLVVPVGRGLDADDRRDADGALDPAAVRTIDLVAARVTAIAAEAVDRDRVTATITTAAARHSEVSDFAVLLVADEAPPWSTGIPHLIGTIDGDDTEQVGRVLRRTASVLASNERFQLLVVILDAVPDDGPPRLSDASVAFIELATSLDRVHLVVGASTEHADLLRRLLGPTCGAFVEGRHDGTGSLATRSEGLDLGTAIIMPTTEIVLPGDESVPPPAPSAGLRARPFVFGRPLSPIERRLARQADEPPPGRAPSRGDTTTDVEIDAAPGSPLAAPVASRAEPSGDLAGRLLPPPFPDRVGQETLMEPTVGERASSLALGIVDRADEPGFDVFRWAPESGNLLAVGHRRSGITTLADLVAGALAGVDADVWVLDPLPQRRRAFRRLPNCRRTADPDTTTSVLRFLADAEERVDHLLHGHLDDVGSSTPEGLAEVVRGGPRPLVIVVADLNRTLAPFDDADADEVTRRLAALRPAPADHDTNRHVPVIAVVAAASRHDEIAPLMGDAADVLVGALDEGERRRFDVPDHALALRHGHHDQVPGRCWSLTRQRLVQLATPPDSVDAFIRERLDGTASADLDVPSDGVLR